VKPGNPCNHDREKLGSLGVYYSSTTTSVSVELLIYRDESLRELFPHVVSFVMMVFYLSSLQRK